MKITASLFCLSCIAAIASPAHADVLTGTNCRVDEIQHWCFDGGDGSLAKNVEIVNASLECGNDGQDHSINLRFVLPHPEDGEVSFPANVQVVPEMVFRRWLKTLAHGMEKSESGVLDKGVISVYGEGEGGMMRTLRALTLRRVP